VSARTSVRRSTVLGLGVLGVVALGGPAIAQVAPLPLPVGGVCPTGTTATASATGTVCSAVTGVTDPLTTPLQPVTATVQQGVAAATAPVQGAVAAPPTGTTSPPTGTTNPPTGTTNPTAPSGTTSTGTDTGTKAAPSGGSATQTTGSTAPAAPTAPAGAGSAVASMPSSFTRSATSLEAFQPGAQLSSGFATAANPMSLFGAPQVAQAPTVSAAELPTPLAVRPAGNGLGSVLPVNAPDDLPVAIVGVALVAVAGSVAAHVVALRSRRQGLATA
jgi:hypothetical protein